MIQAHYEHSTLMIIAMYELITGSHKRSRLGSFCNMNVNIFYLDAFAIEYKGHHFFDYCISTTTTTMMMKHTKKPEVIETTSFTLIMCAWYVVNSLE